MYTTPSWVKNRDKIQAKNQNHNAKQDYGARRNGYGSQNHQKTPKTSKIARRLRRAGVGVVKNVFKQICGNLIWRDCLIFNPLSFFFFSFLAAAGGCAPRGGHQVVAQLRPKKLFCFLALPVFFVFAGLGALARFCCALSRFWPKFRIFFCR